MDSRSTPIDDHDLFFRRLLRDRPRVLMVMVANRSLSHNISLSNTNADKENKYYLIINYSLLY